MNDVGAYRSARFLNPYSLELRVEKSLVFFSPLGPRARAPKRPSHFFSVIFVLYLVFLSYVFLFSIIYIYIP